MFKKQESMRDQPVSLHLNIPTIKNDELSVVDYEIVRLEILLKTTLYSKRDLNKFFSHINVQKEARKICRKIAMEHKGIKISPR